MRRECPHLLSFVEPIPNEFFPPWSHADTVSSLSEAERIELMRAAYDQSYATKTFIDEARPSGLVYAPHFYDLNVLFSKVYHDMSVNVQGLSRGMFIFHAAYFGVEGLKRNYMHQITTLMDKARLSLGPLPVVIGEVGIPWDLNGSKAFHTGDYRKHEELLEALIEAMEQNQVAFTLWNYNPDNSTRLGDGWNKEDFSIMCNDEHGRDMDNGRSDDELYRGGRCLSAIIRPYAVKVAGFPFATRWDSEKLQFEFQYVNGPKDILSANEDSSVQYTTEVFLPAYHFDGHQLRIQVKDGDYRINREAQTVYLDHANTTPGFKHIVRITIEGLPPKKRKSGSWYQLSVQDTFTIVSLIGVIAFCVIVSDYLVKPLLEVLDKHASTDFK